MKKDTANPNIPGSANMVENASSRTRSDLQRLQSLAVSSMAEKVVYHDMQMKIRWANRAACDFYRLPLEKMEGNICYVLLGRSTEECRNCPVKKVLQTGEFHQDILSFPEGKTLLINAHPIWEDGNLIGVVEVSLDITERTKFEEELKKAKNESAAASESKSRFLANVSHEIRTPMNVILGMANLVYESAQSEEHQEYLKMIKDSASFLLTLINDLLDLSKVEAGKLELSQEHFNLPAAVEKIVSSFALQAQEKGLRLSSSIDENVPQIVTGDAARLQQVLFNLIGNGIKFTEQGEVSVSLTLADAGEDMSQAKKQERNGVAPVFFSISDTGIGIPSDKLDRVFQSFTRIESVDTHNYEGTGLGLAISKTLVELMGGSLGVKSVENKGSTFYFTIPFTLLQDTKGKTEGFSAAAKPEESPGEQSSELVGKGLEILLVEDKPMNQKLTTVLLEKKGHHVITANNGKEALDKLQAGRFDLILMDINMPEMDGLEATAHIRAAEKNLGGRIPIIAMTASAMPEDREKCLMAGMDYYVSKPINAQDLYQILEKFRQSRVEDLA